MRAAIEDELSLEEEERQERSRKYRHRYKQRQKEKDKELQQQIEDRELEVERLRLEQADLISQTNALASLAAYSSYMIEALSSAASASAAKARSLGSQAIEGVNSIYGWACHQWVMMPTAAELIAGSVWMPTDDQMRWFMLGHSADTCYRTHNKLLDRISQLLEAGKRSPEAQKHAELQISYSVTNSVSCGSVEISFNFIA
jgi:hypothetical protein